MRVTTVTTFLALAMSVAAMQSNKMTMATAKDQCTTGDIACCDSKETLSADGVLGNLLAKGAINGLLGNDDSACAKTSLLGDVNVLGMDSLTCCDDHQLAIFLNVLKLPPTTPRPDLFARTSLLAALRVKEM